MRGTDSFAAAFGSVSFLFGKAKLIRKAMPVSTAAVSITVSIDCAKPSVMGRVSTGLAVCSQLVSLSESFAGAVLEELVQLGVGGVRCHRGILEDLEVVGAVHGVLHARGDPVRRQAEEHAR